MVTPELRSGPELIAELDTRLAAWDAELAARYPGDPGTRQPVHTVYVTADQFHVGTTNEWGARARRLLAEHAPDAESLAAATAFDPDLVAQVYQRIVEKLRREPIEDLRVDFEDGYGHRADAEEDEAAAAAGAALAVVLAAGDRPFSAGIRCKGLEADTRRRGVRTLELALAGLVAEAGLPTGFVVTLPKVTSPAQVDAMVVTCDRLEQAYGLADGALRFEIQVETPQAVIGPDGVVGVSGMIDAAAGRCAGLHYGTYDYSAACGVAAAHQSLEHPVADFAKAVMQVAAAGTGVRLSDGSTNVVPVGDAEHVRSAWQEHARLVRRSLVRGYYQGWDMHPGHLPTRYLATYAFFRELLTPSAARLRAYVEGVEGSVMDEPATAIALAGAVVRGLDCGAIDEAEVVELAGLGREELDRLARREGAE
jgi:citrate lyase beta subunit